MAKVAAGGKVVLVAVMKSDCAADSTGLGEATYG